MHIALINPHLGFEPEDTYWKEHEHFSGQQVFVKDLALALSQLGHSVDIITHKDDDPSVEEFADTFEEYPGYLGVRILRLPFGREKLLPQEEIWPHLGQELVQAIVEIYRREGSFPDIFSAHFADGGLTAAILKDRQHLGRIPFLFTAHSLAGPLMDRMHTTHDNITYLDREYHLTSRVLAERVSMNHASRIIVQSRREQNREYSHRVYQGAVNPQDDRRFTLIPPGVNLSLFGHDVSLPMDKDVQDYIDMMFDRDLDENRKYKRGIISAGKLTRERNLAGLVRAYGQNELIQELANLVLVVPDLDDPLRDQQGADREAQEVLSEIVRIIDEKELWGKVSVFSLDSEAEMSALYRYMSPRHSIFVEPAFYERFGLSQLEAIASGLPAVVPRNGNLAEYLYDSEMSRTYGVLTDTSNTEEMEDAIEKLLLNSEMWNYFRDAGIQVIRNQYNSRRCAEMYADTALEVLRQAESEEGEYEPTEGIPEYFVNTLKRHDISVDLLADLYFGKMGVIAGHHGVM